MKMMMMKPRSLICFLVLASSSLSRANNTTTEEPRNETTTDFSTITKAPNGDDISLVTPVSPSNQTSPSGNTTDLQDKEEALTPLSDETPDPIEATVSVLTTVSSTTLGGSVALKPDGESGPPSWAYVLLVFILLVIIALCTLLFFLRRASRTYSFDLQRPPVNHHSQPTGTFEAVYLDERPDLKDHVSDDDLSPPPVANGTSQQLEENNSEETTDSPQQPDSNGVDTPTTITTSASADGPADKTSDPQSNADLLLDAVGEQQNENNNNPSVCSTDPFVEINLDEPAWCDQLLTSPVAAASSVLPFSPFAFSSSSSSSSRTS